MIVISVDSEIDWGNLFLHKFFDDIFDNILPKIKRNVVWKCISDRQTDTIVIL